MRVTFLTPRLPPAVCGVGDHTRNLARAMAEEGVDVGFIQRESLKPGGDLPAGPIDHWLDTPASLVNCVREQHPDWLWVQLSGFGYSRWGAPFALSRALKAVRRALPETRLVVCMHEIHCRINQLGVKGPVVGPWQRHTVRSVARQADFIFTSTAQFFRQIVRDYRVDAKKVDFLSIGSNLPEVEINAHQRRQIRRQLGWSSDEVVAVTFGFARPQTRSMERCRPCLIRGIESGKLHRIVCVGGRPGEVSPEFGKWTRTLSRSGALEVMGHQADRRVAEILACSDFAFIYHPPSQLRKSSAFAAFAFAGLPVLVSGGDADQTTDENEPPFIWAESWDWSHVRSSRTDRLREAVRQYALDHCRWEKIASRALRGLEAVVERPGVGT